MFPRMPANTLSGTWKLNAGASTLPFPAPQSVVVEIVMDNENISLTEHSVHADGKEETAIIRARFGGVFYPVTGTAIADGFAIETVDDHHWRTRGAKAGQPAFSATISLAPDGASFREDAETALADGTRAFASLLYERV
jgi:hypothetical protein